MAVYLNPRVVRLARHQHLFGGSGCWGDAGASVPCSGADALPAAFEPVWNGNTKYGDYLHHYNMGNVEWRPPAQGKP